ncbi:MFS transporter [Actinoallomurus sp. NPDC052308]|uniref:MFS transporter n=1 Tax=Actinoallomurus sp. NPDC052308 TaxID=3155530 RepID=UPI00342FB5FB
MLVGGRVAQGVGAALLSPAALSLVVGLFDGEERNKALGIWSALGGGGAALGVLLGGLLTAGPGWPWVFRINMPIGLVIAVVLTALLPARRASADRPRLDVLGAILVTSSSATLIYALIAAGERGWLTALTGSLVLAATVGYVLFVLWQRRARSPLMDVRLLARRPVATGVFLIFMATALMITVFFDRPVGCPSAGHRGPGDRGDRHGRPRGLHAPRERHHRRGRRGGRHRRDVRPRLGDRPRPGSAP